MHNSDIKHKVSYADKLILEIVQVTGNTISFLHQVVNKICRHDKNIYAACTQIVVMKL